MNYGKSISNENFIDKHKEEKNTYEDNSNNICIYISDQITLYYSIIWV